MRALMPWNNWQKSLRLKYKYNHDTGITWRQCLYKNLMNLTCLWNKVQLAIINSCTYNNTIFSCQTIKLPEQFGRQKKHLVALLDEWTTVKCWRLTKHGDGQKNYWVIKFRRLNQCEIPIQCYEFVSISFYSILHWSYLLLEKLSSSVHKN